MWVHNSAVRIYAFGRLPFWAARESLPEVNAQTLHLMAQKNSHFSPPALELNYTVNPLKSSGVRWLHFEVFGAIQV